MSRSPGPLNDLEERETALPEPRKVKREMLAWRQRTHNAAAQFSNQQHGKNWRRWCQALTQWYLNVLPFLEEMETSHRDYSDLQQIGDWVNRKPGEEIEPATLWSLTEKMEALMKELGVTDIGIAKPAGEWGYDFLHGQNYSMDRENEGFRRLKANFENMRRCLRNDTDFMVVVWGGNRVGKDTLAIQLTIPAGQEPDRRQYVMNDGDFWTAVEELPQYSSFYLTEASDHFYSQDTAKKGQKKKKRKLKKYATQNMICVMCDLNFWKIDQEVLTDKNAMGIHIPRRGEFEFYPPAKVAKFERGDDRGEVITPEPAFTGSFPKLTRDDPRWSMYKDIEDEKLDVERETVEENAVNTAQIIQKVKQRIEHFRKPYGDAYIIQPGVLRHEFEELKQDKDALKEVKEVVENDMGWRDA